MTDMQRFDFGNNWNRFINILNDEKISSAENSLRSLTGTQALSGKTFIDVGCGSGIFSLCAIKLDAAKVFSFDYDSDSVSTSKQVKQKYAVGDKWIIEQGDILQSSYVKKLGQHDIVYSWGVLHHTGHMWKALDNIINLVKPQGKLIIALYNDQGWQSVLWRYIKLIYNKIPKMLRPLYYVPLIGILELLSVCKKIITLRFSSITGQNDPRGMDRWHDWLDWLGGYPFEVAKPDEITKFYSSRGFVLEKIITVGNKWGNNEYVFKSIGK